MPKLKDEEQKREQIRALAAQGLSRRAIAEKVGCSVPFVQSTIKPKEAAPPTTPQEPAGEPAPAAEKGELFEVDTTPPPTKPARPKPAQPAAPPAPQPHRGPVRLLL